MATTKEELVNMALTLLGEEPITDILEDNKPARFANAHFDNVRREVLRSSNWTVATKRASLSASATGPVWGFTFNYTLPADFLKLIGTSEPQERYRIEGIEIATDLSPMEIRYVFDLTDISRMDSLLQSAIAAKLAWDMAVPITSSRELMQDMARIYADRLAEARYIDASEGPVQVVEGSRWVDARQGRLLPFRAIEDP